MSIKSYVPFFISQIKEFAEIYNLEQDEIKKITLNIKDLLNQCFVETSTWGIKYWENFLNIIPDDSKSIENRRSNVLARLRGEGTTSKEVIKQIAKSFISDVEVKEKNDDYSFEVYLKSRDGFSKMLELLYSAIEEVKPAHLKAKYKLIAINESSVYFGIALMDGEILTSYPWSSSDVKSNGKANIQIIQNRSLESLMIYPKG
ncbi:putative phage tail protein [uncultured Clostridium sp.]|uniref:putative phage tail protein n=1 Tax=uncultured Clostridium sp. TaxID=59620 RepID=UPI0028EDE6F8|nr:putative phage tail protein [uncultured Clostridium sp.]